MSTGYKQEAKTRYSELLKDPRWQKKRLEILERDEWMCRSCYDSESTLVVHHKRYLPDREPWDYDDNLLITLCENCHEEEREIRRDNEDDLLSMLREKFFACDLRPIVQAFMNLNIRYDTHVMATIIEFALTDNKMMDKIDSEFWKDSKKAKKTKKNSGDNRL